MRLTVYFSLLQRSVARGPVVSPVLLNLVLKEIAKLRCFHQDPTRLSNLDYRGLFLLFSSTLL